MEQIAMSAWRIGLLLAAVGASAQAGGPCGRACLEGFVNQYLDAMAAHDPSRLPAAATVRFTENGQRLALGDGLWNTLSTRGKYRLYMADPRAGQAGFFGTVMENGTPALLALRLKIEGGRIAEIETIVARGNNGGARGEEGARNLERAGEPPPVFGQSVPQARRASRDELMRVSNMYFSGLEKNDGNGIYPFTSDCDRVENGNQTTNRPGQYGPAGRAGLDVAALGCKAQFETGFFHFVTRIRDRRFVLLDEERQLALAFVFFDHAGNAKPVNRPDGTLLPAGPNVPFTWEIAELFKIEGGLIRRIEAVIDKCEYGQNSGWSSWEDGLSSRARWAGGGVR